MEQPLETGEVVEFLDKGRHRLAVVTRIDAGGKSLRVLTEQGREASLPPRSLTARSGARLTPGAPVEAVARALTTLRTRATDRMRGVALEELWELALEAPELLELDQAADLLFSETVDGETRLATLWLLREDRLHFRPRTADAFEPRSAEQVATTLSEAAAEEARTKGRERFVETLVGLLQAPPARRRPLLEEAQRNPIFQSYLDLVIAYAVDGDEAPSARDADALLDEVQLRLGRPLRGGRAKRAFTALVEIGLWTADENLLLRRHAIPQAFPEAVRQEAEHLVREHRAMLEDPARAAAREDFRDWLTLTIDDPETRDIDDALSIQRTRDGYRVAVHIASPTFFVPFDSVLEQCARRRGTSIYLPTGVISMFPEALAEEIFSLIVGQDRPALSFIAEVSEHGEILSERIVPSRVRVNHRLDFDEVDRLIETGQGDLSTALIDLYTAADGLHAARQDGGAFPIPIPERKVRVVSGADTLDEDEAHDDNDDAPTSADSPSTPAPVIEIKVIGEDSMARLLVGEFMVLANTVAARYCAAHGIPVTYRAQAAPEPAPSAAKLEEIPAGLARAFAMRRMMMPARAETTPMPHFGLGVPAYVQATSPIRRYGDLMVHYQLEHHLACGTPLLDLETLRQAQAAAEHAAGTALKVQRETERYWILRYLGQQKARPLAATIVGYGGGERGDRATAVIHEGVFAVSIALKHKVPLGTVVHVCVEGVNARQGQIHARLAE